MSKRKSRIARGPLRKAAERLATEMGRAGLYVGGSILHAHQRVHLQCAVELIDKLLGFAMATREDKVQRLAISKTVRAAQCARCGMFFDYKQYSNLSNVLMYPHGPRLICPACVRVLREYDRATEPGCMWFCDLPIDINGDLIGEDTKPENKLSPCQWCGYQMSGAVKRCTNCGHNAHDARIMCNCAKCENGI